MKKALIFGVSGQDGAYLAKLLLSKGYTVYGTSRDAQVSTFRNLEYLGIHQQIKLESAVLNDFRSVLQVLKKIQSDEVYNLAGQTSVGLSFEQPVERLRMYCGGDVEYIGERFGLWGSRLSFIMRLRARCLEILKVRRRLSLHRFQPVVPMR